MSDLVKYNSISRLTSRLLMTGGSVYMLGISGAGMAPLAAFLLSRGVTVSGVDTAGASPMLSSLGVRVERTHTANIPDGCDLVVYSLAVSETSPELLLARERGIPVITRAELLGALMTRFGTSVAVAGTHGKSTTTAMLDLIFRYDGLDPTVVSGAALSDGNILRIGGDGMILLEACEYKNAFLSLAPTHALITNIEHDHTDFFASLDDVCDSFLRFARSSRRTYICPDSPAAFRIASASGVNAVTYGTPDSDYPLLSCELLPDGTNMTVAIDGEGQDIHLSVAGRGNMLDALGAIAVSHSIGVPVSNIRAALADFSGIGRRIECLGIARGATVYYDYAHHPTEILNTLSVLSMRHERIAVIFKPHTYSRTISLMNDFIRTLRGVHAAVILDVYPAREAHVDGVSDSLARGIGSTALRATDEDALRLALETDPDAVVLMGAGNLDTVLAELKKHTHP